MFEVGGKLMDGNVTAQAKAVLCLKNYFAETVPVCT
jgi:hypothetical protein